MIACKVLQTGSIPPTLNLNSPDPDCDLDYVPNVKHVPSEQLKVAISDNLGFGGHNAALVFKSYGAAAESAPAAPPAAATEQKPAAQAPGAPAPDGYEWGGSF